MKVLILANNDAGLYKFRKELIQELLFPGSLLEERESEPCEVYISLPYGEFVEELKKLGCQYIDTPFERRGMNPLKDLKLLNEYQKMVRKISPDIVLTYTIKPNVYGGIVCRLLKVPYLVNITGLGTSIENEGILSKVILKMYQAGLKKAKTVFFQNESNAKLFKDKRIVGDNVVLIPGSGVNLKEHCFEEYPSEEDGVQLLFIGRIMRDKGIGEYLDCAEHYADRTDVSFHIIGGYDEKAYEDRIQNLQDRNVIQYYGVQKDVHSFMKSHHAVVLPSYHEGLSNVLLEGAATGRPIIATNVPGCRETYEDDVTGIGFESQSSDALIEAVGKFLSLSCEQRADMGVNGRKKIEQTFDKKIVVRAYTKEIDGGNTNATLRKN